MIKIEWLRRLVRLVEDSGIDEVEIQRFGTKVKVRRSPAAGGGPVVTTGYAAPLPAVSQVRETPALPAEPTATSAAEPAAGADETTPASEPAAENLEDVTSPMVGTFYSAPSPDDPPFVSAGDRVEKGQVLCILEAMKLMNELESEVTGVVREVCAENGDPVEYGQTLFRVELG